VESNIEHMRRFMADAAHELRTPLTVLRSHAEIALQQPRDARQYQAALAGIETEARRLGGIVEDLLTLARADAGERPMERRRVYLDDLTIDAVGAARAVGEAKGVSLQLEEFEEAVVDGDATLLRQLIMILLDNAVKFSAPNGDVRIRVGSSGDRPTLTVSDAGLGIPAEQIPRIFERFYRGDPARTRGDADGVRPDGAGLGLAIAKWIADAHGAEIIVNSMPGQGTRVTVAFPTAAIAVTQPHAHRVPAT
jgi:signal transduction histidine kinase